MLFHSTVRISASFTKMFIIWTYVAGIFATGNHYKCGKQVLQKVCFSCFKINKSNPVCRLPNFISNSFLFSQIHIYLLKIKTPGKFARGKKIFYNFY